MNLNIKKILLGIAAGLGIWQVGKAANAGLQETLRGNSKFNVVATVLSIIFIGIGVFMFLLDRKITKMEKNREDDK